MSSSPYHVRRVEEKEELQSLNTRLESYGESPPMRRRGGTASSPAPHHRALCGCVGLLAHSARCSARRPPKHPKTAVCCRGGAAVGTWGRRNAHRRPRKTWTVPWPHASAVVSAPFHALQRAMALFSVLWVDARVLNLFTLPPHWVFSGICFLIASHLDFVCARRAT